MRRTAAGIGACSSSGCGRDEGQGRPWRRATEGPSTADAHWLFKPAPTGLACLCILELPDGEYWVVDSPTGTYLSGHADRGRWRQAEAQYLAQGYVRESEARAQGLIPSSWSRAVPVPPPSAGRRRRVRAMLVVLPIVGGVIAAAALLLRLLMAVVGL